MVQRASGAGAESQRPAVARRIALLGVNLLLVLSVVPWRSDAIFSGGIDPVVAGKALVATVALAGAAALSYSTKNPFTAGLGPAFLVGITLLVSVLGATVAGDPMATIVLTARMLVVVTTVMLLLRVTTWEECVGSLLASMGLIAFVAALTGIPEALVEGRLGGGVPELHPNGLAGLASSPFVGLVALLLHRGPRLWSASVAAGLFFIIVATGSRTALLAVALAVVVAVLVNGVRDHRTVYLLLASAPILYAVSIFTDVFTQLATRAGSTGTTSSLESRFDAWGAVLAWSWTSWQKWIGLGLAVKTVDVDSKWHDEQVLDSSWVSILAQVGLLGVLLAGLLVIWCLLAASASSRRRWVVLPLLILVLLRSVTESGLFDSAEPFVLLMMLSGVLTRRSRHGDPSSSGRTAEHERSSARMLTYYGHPPGRHRGERSAGA